MILWPEGDPLIISVMSDWANVIMSGETYSFRSRTFSQRACLERNARGVFKLQLQQALTTVLPEWSGARGRLQGLLEKQGEWICTQDGDILKRKQIWPSKKEKALILLGIRPIAEYKPEYSCGSPRFCRMWHSAMVIWKYLVCPRVKAVVVRKAALIWWREQFAL